MPSSLRRLWLASLVLSACSEDPSEPIDPVTLVELTPATPGLSPGDTLHFTAAVSGDRGRLFGREVTWSSSTPAVATISDSGVVSGVGTGTTFIRAESEGVKDSVALPVSSPFRGVSVGDRAVCALGTNGAAYCWGYALTGRLGWSGSPDTAGPIPVAGGLTFTALASGGAHTCGVIANGEAWCWGSNFYGELDNSAPNQSSLSFVPVPAGNTTPFVGVTAAFNYSCGIDATGLAYCWGFPCGTDINGMFFCWGNGPGSPLVGSMTYDTVSAGDFHMCGISTAGAPYCWGENYAGQLGVAGALGGADPVQVTLPAAVRSISAGSGYSCAVTVNDDGYCWGHNGEGQLGTGNTTSSPTPVLVAGNHKWSTLVAGSLETCGVALDGITYCWGYLGAVPISNTPLAISGRSFAQVSTGAGLACGRTPGAAIYCWGNGSQGQLGNGLRINTLLLFRVLDP